MELYVHYRLGMIICVVRGMCEYVHLCVNVQVGVYMFSNIEQ